jgi:ubiquinone/menaquinone biosynthesis C-methylase UbiE
MSTKYAHGHSSETISAHSQRTAQDFAKFLLPHLTPGRSLLDIGCGPGSITYGLSKLLSPGRVIGVDQSPSVISIANDTFGSKAKNEDLNLSFQVGDIFKLPFEDNTFDIIFAHQVIIHLPADMVKDAFIEMKRVVKLGGLVAIRDAKPDNGGHQIYPFHPLMAKTIDIILARARSTGSGKEAGGTFMGIGKEVGFTKVEREFSLDVYDSEEKRRFWGGQWAKRCQEEAFKEFALRERMLDVGELDGMGRVWEEWVENEDGWATMLEIEHLFWK